jgi:hypothetical protein
MKNIITLLLTLFIAQATFADVGFSGFSKRNGTLDQSHFKPDTDSNFFNDFSPNGNINPHAGKKGTVPPPRVH